MIANEIRQHLQDVCARLNENLVEYMLIGGVAVGFYGYQRISGGGIASPAEMKHDLDFWYNPHLENFEKLLKSLKDLGVNSHELDEIIFVPGKNYLRISFDKFKLEFLPKLSGLDKYSECKRNSRQVTLDGNLISIIGYGDLMKNKQTVGREIDKRDIQELREIHFKSKTGNK